jgi:hypothetical protein
MFKAALEAVVDYMWDDELEDCQEQYDNGESPDDHIFSHLVVLYNQVNGTDHKPMDFLTTDIDNPTEDQE